MIEVGDRVLILDARFIPQFLVGREGTVTLKVGPHMVGVVVDGEESLSRRLFYHTEVLPVGVSIADEIENWLGEQ